MKGKTFVIFSLITCIVACSKDKLQTTPSLKLKSISRNNIPVEGSMNIALEFTDKEGTGDTICIYKKRNNLNVTTTVRDSVKFLVPTFPDNSKGEMDLQLDYDDHLVSAQNPPSLPPPATGKESDSLTFKLILKDNTNHVSDTV